MKNILKLVGVIISILFIGLFTTSCCVGKCDIPDCLACNQLEQANNQSATLTHLFGGGRSATVQGYLTDTEWKGLVGKVRSALEDAYFGNIPPVQGIFLDVFGQSGVTIIVEKTTAYPNWKTTGDGKTLYIRFDKLDDIQSALTAAVQSMAGNGDTQAKANPVRDGWHKINQKNIFNINYIC